MSPAERIAGIERFAQPGLNWRAITSDDDFAWLLRVAKAAVAWRETYPIIPRLRKNWPERVLIAAIDGDA